eukprot:3501397-Alexandrium_andersonii.AAC.1
MALVALAVLDEPQGLVEVPAQAAAVEVVLVVVALAGARPAALLPLGAGRVGLAHALHDGLQDGRVRGDGHPAPTAARDDVEVHTVKDHLLPRLLRAPRQAALDRLGEARGPPRDLAATPRRTRRVRVAQPDAELPRGS